MNKRYERNHFKAFSNSVNRKKMYKKGKNWIIGSLTLLALTGMGVSVDHSVHADADVNTKAATTSVGSTADIEHQAKAMYNGMIAHSMTTPTQGKAKLANNGEPSVTSGSSASSSSAASGSAAKATPSVSQPANNKGTDQAKPAVHFGGFGAMREVGDAQPSYSDMNKELNNDKNKLSQDATTLSKVKTNGDIKDKNSYIKFFQDQNDFNSDLNNFINGYYPYSEQGPYSPIAGQLIQQIGSGYSTAKIAFGDAEKMMNYAINGVPPSPERLTPTYIHGSLSDKLSTFLSVKPPKGTPYDAVEFVYTHLVNGQKKDTPVSIQYFTPDSDFDGVENTPNSDLALYQYFVKNGSDRFYNSDIRIDHWTYMPKGYEAVPDSDNVAQGTYNEDNMYGGEIWNSLHYKTDTAGRYFTNHTYVFNVKRDSDAPTNEVLYKYTTPEGAVKYTVAYHDKQKLSDFESKNNVDGQFLGSNFYKDMNNLDGNPSLLGKFHQIYNLPQGYVPAVGASAKFRKDAQHLVFYDMDTYYPKYITIPIVKSASDTITFTFSLHGHQYYADLPAFSGPTDQIDGVVKNYYHQAVNNDKWEAINTIDQQLGLPLVPASDARQTLINERAYDYRQNPDWHYDGTNLIVPLELKTANMHIYYEDADNGSQISSAASLQANVNAPFSIGNYSSKNYAPSSISGYHQVDILHPTTTFDPKSGETHTIDVLYAPNTSTRDYAPAVDTVKYLNQQGAPISASTSNMAEYSRSDDVNSASSATYGSWVTSSAFSAVNYPSMISANGSYYSEVSSGTNLTVPTSSEINTSLNNSNVNHFASFENDIYYSLVSSGTVTIHYVDSQGSELSGLNSSVATNLPGESFTMPWYPSNVSDYHEFAVNASLGDHQNGQLPAKFNGGNQDVYVHYDLNQDNIHVYYENADNGANLLTGSSYSNFTAGARAGFNLSDAVPNYKSKFNGYHFVNALHPTTKYDSDNNEIHTVDLLYAPNTSTKDYAPAIDTVNYLISGTNTPVSAPANNVTEYSRADVSSASSASYGSWATNRAFSSISYPSVISADGKYYREVATGTDLTPPTNAQVSDSLDNSSTNHLASFANNVYYVPASSASGSQSAVVNETVDYILYSKGGSTVKSSASEVVNYMRPDSYNQYTGQVTASGNWSATNSFNVPASPSYKGWHVIASNLSMPDTANLQPNDRLSFNYQVDYVSDTYGVTSSAVSSTANERINYYQGDSLASSYSSAVNVSQTRYSYSGQNFSGGWSTRTPFSSQADPSYPGWTIDSRSGSIPVGVSTLNPGTYTENVYYDPAKANVHIYYENAVTTSEIANYPEVSLSADARAPFNLNDYLNHNYEKSIAGFSYVGALHATSSFDPTNGETHNIDLLYQPTSSQSTNEAPATDTVNYYVQGATKPFSSAVSTNQYARADVTTAGVQSYGPWLTGTDFSAINVPAEISSAGHYYHLVSANSTLPTPDQVNSALGNAASVGNASFTNDIVYAPDNVINSSENASATETTYCYWNNGSSNVSSASATNTYDYARSASYDVNTQRFLSAGGWSQTNHTATKAQGSAANGYHLIGSFGTLPNSAALTNDLIANQGTSYANYVVYAPDSVCDTHDFASATDKVNYLVSGTSSAVSPASTSVLVYSRADVNNHTTGKSSVSDWRTNGSFSQINVPQYLVSNGTTYSEVSANQTLPNVAQNSLNANNANYSNNVYYVPVTNGTVAIHYVDSDGQELPNVPVQYSSKPAGTAVDMPVYPAQLDNFHSTNQVDGYTQGMTYPSDNQMKNIYVHYAYNENSVVMNYVNTANGKVIGHFYPSLLPKAKEWTIPNTAFQQLPSNIAQNYEFNNSYDNDANQKLMRQPTVTVNGKTIVNVYVQPKPTQSDGIVTINYVTSDFQPVATARRVSGPVNSTVDINTPGYIPQINGYQQAGLSINQATYRDYNQNVYVIYRPVTPVSHDGHIHVRYVNDDDNQMEFFSDKYSDAVGQPFNLDDDNYMHRNIPGYHYDGRVYNPVSAYGRYSKFDPHVIVVGYAKDSSDSTIHVHQTSYADDLINYIENDNGHLTVLKSSSERVPFSGNATVNKDTGQFSSATSWSAEKQFSSVASLTFSSLSQYSTVGNVPASAAVGDNYVENVYYRPISSASSATPQPMSSASSQASSSSATPASRSAASVTRHSASDNIPVNMKPARQRAVTKKYVKNLVHQLNHLIKHNVRGMNNHQIHRIIKKLNQKDQAKARVIRRHVKASHRKPRYQIHNVRHYRRARNLKGSVHQKVTKRTGAKKLPQTGEAQNYSALYAMLFVISAVILADLGKAIDKRHDE